MREYELIIIGGGPAGLSAALAACDCGVRKILIIDRNAELGGLLFQCIHKGFGARRFGAELTGPEYAERLISLVNGKAEIRTSTSVIELLSDCSVITSGKHGVERMSARAVIMATGCRERPIGSLPVCGTRPAGVFTAGSAQKMINLGGYSVGERIVILGSGDIGLIMARRLTLNGKKVLAVVEQSERCGGLPRNRIQCVEDFGIPLLTRSTVERLYGVGRLTGVRISDGGTGYDLDCDTLIVSVGLVPETDLLWKLGTIPPWLFVCGNANIIRVLADDIADDGAAAGRNAAGLIKEL